MLGQGYKKARSSILTVGPDAATRGRHLVLWKFSLVPQGLYRIGIGSF